MSNTLYINTMPEVKMLDSGWLRAGECSICCPPWRQCSRPGGEHFHCLSSDHLFEYVYNHIKTIMNHKERSISIEAT